jgi:hypothetical protein
MLSRWRKEAREGRLRGRGNVTLREMRDIRKLSGIERAYALLKEEHELLKKAIRFCSTRRPQWDEVLVAPTTSVRRSNLWPVVETGRRAGNVLASLGISVRRLAAILFLLGASASLRAQQPFLTDDPNVTARGKFHFESYNQFAVLSVIARPGLSQDTTNLVLQYGLLERVEANVDIPLLLLMNDRTSANAFGLGDLDFAVKVRLLDETPGTLWPAVAVTVALELPTGSASRGLGSGFTDFGVNTIYQKSLAKGTTLQANLGYQFNGNTLTGDIGIRTIGRILSSGVSVAHDVAPFLRLGLDLNGALIKDTGPGGRQLQLTAGGNYTLAEDATLDFALATGWFSSPRFAVLIGVAKGF